MYIWSFRALPLKTAVALAAVTTLVLSSGCSSTSDTGSRSGSSSDGITNIKVAAIPTADLAGLYIAQNNGLFAKEGLRINIVQIASSQAVINAQLKGQVDVSAGSYIPYITAQAGGARFRILAEASTLAPGCRMLITRSGSAVKTVANLAGKKIGVNGTNSIGTLLISALLAEHGLSPKDVSFVTEQSGFPVMPGELKGRTWDAAFLAEPYVTLAGENYGEQELADLDQGATMNFPIDGYVATQSWARRHPATAAAFVRAVEAGQALADTSRASVEGAMAKSDNLPSAVTSLMSVPDFPVGPVDQTRIEREATAMLQFGMLGPQFTSVVDRGTLIRSMLS